MDSIKRLTVKKRKKSNGEGKDIISNLPDNIIGHILSFLPTKYAVRTSTLSKRWINLWTFITKLRFEDREPHSPHCRSKIRKTPFQNFVYRVLLHLNTSSIQSFSLSLPESHAPHHVNRWISDILNRRVKELYIKSKKKLDISSHSFFEKTSSLEILVLNMNGHAVRVNVPNFVSLSHLTVLELSAIIFTCDISNNSKKLMLNLPVLKKYKAENCTWLNVKHVTFDVPLLQVLLIKHTPEYISDESRTVIEFSVTCLTEFSYYGYMLPNSMLLDIKLDLPKARIASANIHLLQFEGESEEKAAFLACELMKQFNNNVECLKYERSKKIKYYEQPGPTHVLPLTDLPEFGILTCLELGNVAGTILLDFLHNTPFLKTLILKGLVQFEEELSNHDNVPPCFISNLQWVDFGIINGAEHELRFAKFVMENALVLRRARFTTAWNFNWLSGLKFEKVKKKIFSFKRSVSFEFIEFSSFSY